MRKKNAFVHEDKKERKILSIFDLVVRMIHVNK